MRFRILAFSCALLAGGLLAVRPAGEAAQSAAPARTLFEGARLIAGDGRAPLENSAVLVENDRSPGSGGRATITLPRGAARVDLDRQDVIPADRRSARPRRLPEGRDVLRRELHARQHHRSPEPVSVLRHRRR